MPLFAKGLRGAAGRFRVSENAPPTSRKHGISGLDAPKCRCIRAQRRSDMPRALGFAKTDYVLRAAGEAGFIKNREGENMETERLILRLWEEVAPKSLYKYAGNSKKRFDCRPEHTQAFKTAAKL